MHYTKITYDLYFTTDFIFCVQDACALLTLTLLMFSKANTDKLDKILLGLSCTPNMFILILQKVYIKVKRIRLQLLIKEKNIAWWLCSVQVHLPCTYPPRCNCRLSKGDLFVPFCNKETVSFYYAKCPGYTYKVF